MPETAGLFCDKTNYSWIEHAEGGREWGMERER